MRYEYTLAVPANTAKRLPAATTCKLTQGVITAVRVFFPPGCAGLVHARVRQGGHQVWPTNPEADFSGDSAAIEWSEYHELLAAPYQLVLEAWSDDDTYAHTVYLSIVLLPREIAEAGRQDLSLVGKWLRRLIGL